MEMLRLIVHAAILLCVVFLAYRRAVTADFTFDDHLAIEGNPDCIVGEDESFWNASLFGNDFWGNSISSPNSHRSYRPITVLTFRAQYFFNGRKFVPSHFHLLNVVIHFIVTFQLYWMTLRGCALLGDDCSVSARRALVAAVLFAVHPVHTEAVTSVVGRAELLCAMFGLLALYFYHLSSVAAFRGLCGFIVFFTAAVLSKDSGVVVAALCILLDLVRVLHIPTFRDAFRFKVFRPMLFRILTAVSCVISYLTVRRHLFSSFDLAGSGLLRYIENPHLFMKTSPSVFLWYLATKNALLLVWPWPLCAEYCFDCLPAFPEKWWMDDRTPLMILTTAAVLLGTFWICSNVWLGVKQKFLRLSHIDRTRFHFASARMFAVAWIVITFLPVSHVFVTVGTMLAERCLFIPSIGLCLLVCLLIPSRRLKSASFWGVLLVIAALAVQLCAWRNADWQSDERVFESSIRVCPRGAKHYQQLALVRYNQNRLEDGKELLLRAIEIDPQFCEPHWHIARYFYNQTMLSEALRHLRLCSACATQTGLCYPLYLQVRAVVNRSMSYADGANDSASILRIVPLHEGAAHQFRQAGLGWRNEEKFCRAATALNESLHEREMGRLVGPLNNNSEDTYCNTKYWYGVSMVECATTTNDTGLLRSGVMDLFGLVLWDLRCPPSEGGGDDDTLGAAEVSLATIVKLFELSAVESQWQRAKPLDGSSQETLSDLLLRAVCRGVSLTKTVEEIRSSRSLPVHASVEQTRRQMVSAAQLLFRRAMMGLGQAQGEAFRRQAGRLLLILRDSPDAEQFLICEVSYLEASILLTFAVQSRHIGALLTDLRISARPGQVLPAAVERLKRCAGPSECPFTRELCGKMLDALSH